MPHLTRKTSLAIAGALLASAATASGAAAAGPTSVSCSGGIVSITAAAGTSNAIAVSDAGAGKYDITDAGSGATLTYVSGGCLTGVSVSTQKHGVITVSGAITQVKVSTGDLNDLINTQDLAGKAALFGGAGNDILIGGNGASSLNGQAGDDNITGGSGNDSIAGEAGVDTINAGGGNDTIFAADGFLDKIDGGAGFDTANVDQVEQSVVNVESATL